MGISSFASVGNKLDVSSNDMLMWWEHDDVTRLAVLYLESFGNPRKFARTARRVGAKMPVLTVHAGRSAVGQQAAASHTAAVATPLVSREALFEQAGVIATRSFGELTETVALLATQPVPAGRTVAIVSNVGGAGVLAADACADLGLRVHQPRGLTRRRLRTLLPGGTVTGPVDTTAAVSGEDFRRCLELLAADEEVDACSRSMRGSRWRPARRRTPFFAGCADRPGARIRRPGHRPGEVAGLPGAHVRPDEPHHPVPVGAPDLA